MLGGIRKTISIVVSDGKAVFDNLPLGPIEVREVKAPRGYLLDHEVYVINLEADKAGHEAVWELELAGVLYEQVVRGDLELVKVSSWGNKPLSGVPFKITSMTTGESHVIVTDSSGRASTASSWTLHSLDTNGGKAGSGIWFGSGSPDDEKGALPFDTYRIEELACGANRGLILASAFEVTVDEQGKIVDLGTIVNELEVPPSDSPNKKEPPSGDKSIEPAVSISQTLPQTSDVAFDGFAVLISAAFAFIIAAFLLKSKNGSRG